MLILLGLLPLLSFNKQKNSNAFCCVLTVIVKVQNEFLCIYNVFCQFTISEVQVFYQFNALCQLLTAIVKAQGSVV